MGEKVIKPEGLLVRDAEERDLRRIKEIAMADWMVCYDYLPRKELERLVDEYYSHKNLSHSLKNARNGRDCFVVGEISGKVVGFCHVISKKKMGEIRKIYVDMEHIGKGIGKKLLGRCEEFLLAKGCGKCFAFVNMHNKIGRDFYARNGFVRVKEKDIEDEFRNGKVLWYVEKEL